MQDWNNQESMLQIATYFLAFVSITFNIYIFCHIGEMLVEQCQKIGVKCYMIEWYRLPHHKARSLIFSIIMSNYNIELTAGKMVTMTMSSFSNVSTPIHLRCGYLRDATYHQSVITSETDNFEITLIFTVTVKSRKY